MNLSIITAKGRKTVYFLTKHHNYFWKHGKRINIQKRFFTPCTFRHSRAYAHARVRRFSTFVFASSPLPFKTLCVNGLSVKASPLYPSPSPPPKALGVYALCTFHAKRSDLAATARNEGGDGVERSRRRTTRWTKGEGKGEVKPSPLMRYISRS